MSQTLADILAVTRRHLNEPSAIQWTDAELVAYINDGQRFLVSEIIQFNPDYFLSRATASCVANQAAYATPADLHGGKIREMWVKDTGGTLRAPVRMVTPDKANAASVSGTGLPSMFARVKGGFILSPLPDAAYELEMWYDAAPVDYTAGSTGTESAYSGAENEVVSLWAAIKAKNSRGEDTTRLEKLLSVVQPQATRDSESDVGITVDYDPIG